MWDVDITDIDEVVIAHKQTLSIISTYFGLRGLTSLEIMPHYWQVDDGWVMFDREKFNGDPQYAYRIVPKDIVRRKEKYTLICVQPDSGSRQYMMFDNTKEIK